jgi:peptide/nickel transport system substrate-binding protein
MTNPGQQEERIEAWRQIYLDIMKDAPWVPVFNEQRFTYHSDAVAGDDSLFVDPVHIPVHYDYVYSTEAE